MAFTFGSGSSVSVASPERMFLDFSERKLAGLLTHQGRVLTEYQEMALKDSDVAIKLPTGSGKTLVGLLIADWRRRLYKERVLYVCPTRQLVNQVVKEASEKYGMGACVHAFVGRQREYDQNAKGMYQSGDTVAVTTYGGLFNANPFFDDPHLILFDDAHSAENYMAAYWTVSLNKKDHPAAFFAVAGALLPIISGLNYRRLRDDTRNNLDLDWVDLVPNEYLGQVSEQIGAALDEHAAVNSFRYAWSAIRDHLAACKFYLSANEILIRPIIPPTMRYAPFASARQRIYMSATLGEGGDLERLTGVAKISRLSVSDDFNIQGVGRRFFIMPGRSLTDTEQVELECDAIERAGRAVVLVPDFKQAEEIGVKIKKELSVPIFSAAEIEDSKSAFINSDKAVAILANRYDGIDFAGDQCRLLIMQGLPGASNLQEKFLSSRMSARVLLADRIRTRVVQAVGRCTRSATDFSAVMILGEDLITYLSKSDTRDKLHPELQAELEFGIQQSGSKEGMLENLNYFYARGEEWRSAESEIRRIRSLATQQRISALDQLASAAPSEVRYQYALWDGDYETSLEEARKALTMLVDPGLQGYRALWSYLAGHAASCLCEEGRPGLKEISRGYYSAAAKAATGIIWLRELSGTKGNELSKIDLPKGSSAAPMIPRLEAKLDALGTRHDQKYSKLEREIFEGVMQTESAAFENAQILLGELLGFHAGNSETSGAPVRAGDKLPH